MPRMKRQPEKFDVLDLYTAVGRNRGYRIGEPKHIDDFVEELTRNRPCMRRNPSHLMPTPIPRSFRRGFPLTITAPSYRFGASTYSRTGTSPSEASNTHPLDGWAKWSDRACVGSAGRP